MTPSFRTILKWLTDHNLSDDAEVWILGDYSSPVEPVTEIGSTDEGAVWVETSPVWKEPVPVPMHYGPFYARLLECYSGAGTLQWLGHSDTYRGSYTVNPHAAVFLLFLPDSIDLLETHTEKMEQRKKQARELTEVIEKSWQQLT